MLFGSRGLSEPAWVGAHLRRSGNQAVSFKSVCIIFKNCCIEPVGGQKPKFSEDVNSKSITRDVQNSVTLICPAQSFPTPSFR